VLQLLQAQEADAPGVEEIEMPEAAFPGHCLANGLRNGQEVVAVAMVQGLSHRGGGDDGLQGDAQAGGLVL